MAGYKRQARIAFVSAAAHLAEAAVRTAARDGAGWIDATAIACGGLETLDSWGEQDLLVSLDEPAKALLASVRPKAPTRHYGVDQLAPADQQRAVEQRVKSMVAGMRMFARDSRS